MNFWEHKKKQPQYSSYFTFEGKIIENSKHGIFMSWRTRMRKDFFYKYIYSQILPKLHNCIKIFSYRRRKKKNHGYSHKLKTKKAIKFLGVHIDGFFSVGLPCWLSCSRAIQCCIRDEINFKIYQSAAIYFADIASLMRYGDIFYKLKY